MAAGAESSEASIAFHAGVSGLAAAAWPSAMKAVVAAYPNLVIEPLP